MTWAYDAGKIALTALIIFGVAQLSERSTLLAAILASVPIVSVLAMVWMHHDGTSGEEMSTFAKEVMVLVVPSLLLFLVMAGLLDRDVDFYPALGAGLAATVLGYLAAVKLLQQIGWPA